MKLVNALVLLSTTASSLMITAYADDEHATPALRAAAGSTNSAAASSVASSSFLEQAKDIKTKLVVKEANANAYNGNGKKNGRPFGGGGGGGGGGCRWPLDQFLCLQGPTDFAIKYTVCPSPNPNQEGKKVGDLYLDGIDSGDLIMSEYISPTEFRDRFAHHVLVDEVTVQYGANSPAILSATDCL